MLRDTRNMRQTLVLIVAPRGLAHPRAWAAWEEASHISVVVHAPERAGSSEYERSRRLDLKFGDPEMVVGGIAHLGETLRAVCAVCDRDEGFDHLVPAPPNAAPTRRLDVSMHIDTASLHSLWGAVLSRDTCLRLVATLWTPENFHDAAVRTLAAYGNQKPEENLGGCMAAYALPRSLLRAVGKRASLGPMARGTMRREIIEACALKTLWFVAGDDDEQSLDDKFLATIYGGPCSSVMEALASERAASPREDDMMCLTLRPSPDFRLWWALKWERWRDVARVNGYNATLTTAEVKRAGIREPPNALAVGVCVARIAVAAAILLAWMLSLTRAWRWRHEAAA